MPADDDFLDRLQNAWGHDLFAGEFSHAGEHSIEFQAVYLRSLGLAGEDAAPMVPDPVRLAAQHGAVQPHRRATSSWWPASSRRCSDTMADDGRRITLIAAVDLAHMGPRFGDRLVGRHRRTRPRFARPTSACSSSSCAPDADGYYADVMRDRDARRICGFTPIYLLTALMQAEQRAGEVLRYTQWVDRDLSSSVTFCSAVFR